MKNVKKMLLVCVICVMSLMMCEVKCEAATQIEALQWVKSQLGNSIDVDGAYGAQCVDLIKAYYSYLGVSPASGNGCDYAWNALPSGWTRIQGGIPQPGDILVYGESSSNPYGHVAIFESTYSTYHQNFSGSYVEQVTRIAYNGFTNPYWGVIRPVWKTTPDITNQYPSVSISASGVMTASFSGVSNVHHYDVVLYGTNYAELNYTNVETSTSGSLQLPRYGVYFVGINAYGSDGSKTSSQWTRCVWSGLRNDVGTNVITMLKSNNGKYLYADTDSNLIKTTKQIDYNNLDKYFFKFVRLNSNNDYVIYSMANDKVLTVKGDSIACGNQIGLGSYSGDGSQTYAIKNSYDGNAYVIFPVTYSYIFDGGAEEILYIYDYTHYSNNNQYFTFEKLNMNPTVEGFEGEYDGKEHVITVGDVPSDATIEYKLGSEGTWSTSHPLCKEVGSYDIYYKVEHEYYATYTGLINITIEEKTSDSEGDSNVDDDGKDDSVQDENVDDEKNNSEQKDNLEVDDDTEDLEEGSDSEKHIEVGSRVGLSTGCYSVTSVSDAAREVTYVCPKNTKKTSITIPDTIKINGYTYKVTEIASKAFKNNKKLKSVTIGKNVKKIGKEAFCSCKKLKKITIKSKVLKSVGKNAIKNIHKKATIRVQKTQLKKYKKLFKSKTGYKKSMKIKK